MPFLLNKYISTRSSVPGIITEALTEAGRKRGFQISDVKMRSITEVADAEAGDTLLSFFRVDDRD